MQAPYLAPRSMRRRATRAACVCAVVGMLTVLGAALGPVQASAAAEEIHTPRWSSYLPGGTTDFDPSSEDDCVAGRPSCIKHTLKEMGRIFTQEARSCSHDAIFALSYMRITQTYRWTTQIDGYYEDVRFANHQAAVFARYFTDAFHAYHEGRDDRVPEAWRHAFDAAEDRATSGSGDLLLGMNAHINRDLPYVVAAVGLVAPDGSSRKPDYDKVEHFLRLATEPMLAEAAARFDPTIDDADDPWGLSYEATFQMVSAWRESAWRHAEALVSARTPEERAAVEAMIERNAVAVATSIKAATSYSPPLTSTEDRDRYCLRHHGDDAPQDYPFGDTHPWRWR